MDLENTLAYLKNVYIFQPIYNYIINTNLTFKNINSLECYFYDLFINNKNEYYPIIKLIININNNIEFINVLLYFKLYTNINSEKLKEIIEIFFEDDYNSVLNIYKYVISLNCINSIKVIIELFKIDDSIFTDLVSDLNIDKNVGQLLLENLEHFSKYLFNDIITYADEYICLYIYNNFDVHLLDFGINNVLYNSNIENRLDFILSYTNDIGYCISYINNYISENINSNEKININLDYKTTRNLLFNYKYLYKYEYLYKFVKNKRKEIFYCNYFLYNLNLPKDLIKYNIIPFI